MNRVSAAVVPPSRTTPSRLTASKYSSDLVRSWPPSVSPNSEDYGLQVCTITASKCISKLAPSRLQSASPNSLKHILQVYLYSHSITASKCISKLARSQPPSVCPNSIMAAKLALSRPRCASLSSLDQGVVKQWSWMADRPSSTLRRTSHGIRTENSWERVVQARGA